MCSHGIYIFLSGYRLGKWGELDLRLRPGNLQRHRKHILEVFHLPDEVVREGVNGLELLSFPQGAQDDGLELLWGHTFLWALKTGYP